MKDLIRRILLEERENWTNEKLRELTLKYDSLNDFITNQKNAYNALRRKGLFDEYTSHMVKLKTYTDNDVENEARKYSSVTEFKTKSPNYYSIAKKRGLMNKFREFLTVKNKTWTNDMLRDEALKYNKKNEFNKNSPSAYKTAYTRGILDDITKHMDQIKIWSYDEAKEESKKYINKQDFKKSLAFYQSVRNGWIDDFFDNTYVSWTKEMAYREALKYETKSEFKFGSPRAYSAAHTHGWIDDITKHMIPVGNLYERMIYIYEFSDNHVYIGLTSNKKRRHKEHTDIEKMSSPVAKHIVKTGLNPLYKEESIYISAEDAQNLEQCTIDKYRSEGWTLLNKQKGGGLGSCKRTTLTMEIIRDLASGFPTRVAFKKVHKNEYQTAQKYGWLQDVFQDIPVKKGLIWDYEKTKEEATKYGTRSEFRFGNQSAYNSAIKNKWIDEFFPKNK
jgi:hypothetical protein